MAGLNLRKRSTSFFFKRDCTCPTRRCSPTWAGIQYAISTEILPINGDFTDNRPIWPTSAFRQHWCQDGMVGKIILSMNLENHTLVLPSIFGSDIFLENHSLPKKGFLQNHTKIPFFGKSSSKITLPFWVPPKKPAKFLWFRWTNRAKFSWFNPRQAPLVQEFTPEMCLDGISHMVSQIFRPDHHGISMISSTKMGQWLKPMK